MKIQEWREEINRYFPDFVLPAEIGLSVIGQLFLLDITNPFGLVYVDVPSSGKTIVLNFFSESKNLVYTTDNFSPAAFVSHAADVKKEDLSKIDLLPRIKNKVLMVRDLAPIFGQRDDDLLKTMGILTRIFDGEGLEIDGGRHGKRGYTGDYLFMFLAASTPISPKIFKVMGNFGSRLFFLNLNSGDKSFSQLAEQVTSKISVKGMETKCREITSKFISEIEKLPWEREKDDKSIVEEIARIAKMVACLRGAINVWREKSDGEDFNFTTPIVEKPDRINQAFYNLARGHALICNRTTLKDVDLAILLKVALSSASLDRTKLFNLLIENNGRLTTEDVIHGMKCSRPTALSLMEKFKHLEIVDEIPPSSAQVGRSEKVIGIKDQFSWFLGKRFQDLHDVKLS